MHSPGHGAAVILFADRYGEYDRSCVSVSAPGSEVVVQSITQASLPSFVGKLLPQILEQNPMFRQKGAPQWNPSACFTSMMFGARRLQPANESQQGGHIIYADFR